MMKFLAAASAPGSPADIIGNIRPPVNDPVLSNPTVAIGNIFATGIRLTLLFAAITLLIYLMWGAFDWITSAGDKENVTKAQNKLTNAVIGMIVVVAALTVFQVVTGDILGIIKRDANGNWNFCIPSITGVSCGAPPATPGACVNSGGSCSIQDQNCCAGATCQPVSVDGSHFVPKCVNG